MVVAPLGRRVALAGDCGKHSTPDILERRADARRGVGFARLEEWINGNHRRDRFFCFRCAAECEEAQRSHLLDSAHLVIDHHPEQPGYSAVFKDIRADYGSTSTILTEHLRAVDVNISERTATAMLYAIKSDTLFFNRQANRVDLEAFSFLYPLADAALIRKMEGAEITFERLQHVMKAMEAGRRDEQVFASFIGQTAREDLIAYVSDFFLQLEDVKWTIVSGIVNENLVMSVRNLGYSRNAGEFVRKYFSELGSAGGHRAMAKAVVPLNAFREKYGNLSGTEMNDRILEMAVQFLREHQTPERRREIARAG